MNGVTPGFPQAVQFPDNRTACTATTRALLDAQNRDHSRSKPLRISTPYATRGLVCLPHQRVPDLDPGRVAFDHPACSPSTLGLLRKPAQTHCLFFEGIKKMYRHLHSISFWIYCTQGTRSPWPLRGVLDQTNDHIACSGTPKAL